MKDSWFHVLIVVLILGSTFILLADDEDEVQVVGGMYGAVQQDTISVSGQSEYIVAPDEAELMIVVETTGGTAKEAQDMNSAKSNAVVLALTKFVDKDDIETVSYYLYPLEYFNPQTNKPVPQGYRQTHTMKVTLKDIGAVGDVIDAATNAGATGIQGVSFVLSDDLEEQANTHALGMAVQNARQKADALAHALKVGVGDVVTVSESNYQYYPRPIAYGMDMAVGASEKTPILPQDVTISLNVNVIFEIED
jgi:uncharacterized protein YggE